MPRQATWGILGSRPQLTSRGTGYQRPTGTPVGLGQVGDLSREFFASQIQNELRDDEGRNPLEQRDAIIAETQAAQEALAANPNADPLSTFGTTADILGISEDQRRQHAINTGIDVLSGLPFGITSTLVNPQMQETSWGTDFNTGGGGLIGVGGRASLANLERVYGNIQENPEYGNFYAPGDIPGVNTPIATHEGLVPGTRVVSGNVDLLPESVDANQDGVRDAAEVDAYVAERQRIAAEQEAARVREEQRAALATDTISYSDGQYGYGDQRFQSFAEAETAEANAIAAQAQREREAAEAAARERAAAEAAAAEQTRREREAAEAARAEAERQENIRRANEELARSNQEREDSGQAPQQGRAVTDSRGNPVRDSSGGIVTDRPTDHGGGDSGGGGGGGGTWCCTAAMSHGMPVSKVKALRKWHRQQSQLWQDGYDRWGFYLAEKLVKKSPFWASVTEAGHDWFVNRYYTPKGALAWLMIVPGSYIAGVIDAIQK